MTKKRFRRLPPDTTAAMFPFGFKRKRAFTALALAAVIVFLTVMSPVGGFLTVQAADEPVTGAAAKSIIADISLLAPSDGKWDSSDNKVWYGQYEGSPTAYRVLRYDDINKMLLLDCDTILKTPIQFNNTMYGTGANDWTNSTLKTYLNEYNTIYAMFQKYEENAICLTPLPASNFSYDIGSNKYADVYWKGKFFVLSANEANSLYADNAARIKGANNWWLRSYDAYSDGEVGVVYSNGGLGIAEAIRTTGYGVSPAFCVSTDKAANPTNSPILFASPKGENKADSFALTKNDAVKDWIFTITDGNLLYPVYRKTSEGEPSAVEPGDTITMSVTIPYLDPSPYTQLSAMLVDSSGAVVSYGKIKDDAPYGTWDVPVTIPEGVASVPGDYTIKVFAETVRSSATNICTDTCSLAASCSLRIEPKSEIKLQAGTGAVLTSDSATANQTILGGESMTMATYKAADGYYFPLGYGFEQNGLTVGRIDDKHISVVGCPTADTAITITASPVSDRAKPVTDKQNINLGAGTLVTAYTDAAGSDTGLTKWDMGAKVYFGQYDGTNGTAYRVLESDGAIAYLDCDSVLYERPFNSSDYTANAAQKSGNPNEYNGSDLQVALNGSEFYDKSGVFTSTEKTAIRKTALAAENQYPMNPTSTSSDNFVMDYASANYIFPISGKDASRYYDTTSTAYGVGASQKKDNISTNRYWWLRSAYSNPNYFAGYFNNQQYLITTVDNSNVYVAPAFQIILSSVLFTAAAGTDKTSFAAVGSDKVSANTWKLTMQAADGTMNAALASDNTGSTKLSSAYTAQTYSVSHAAASSVLPGATQVSAMLTQVGSDGKDAGLAYYGQVNSDVSAVKSSVSLPAGLADGTYHLYVFAEDVNDNNQTDYASALGTPITVRIQDTVISTDITWGSMEFTYNDGSWNTETHVWDGAGWEPSSTDADKITIQNSGNVNVTVSFSYMQNSELYWLSSNNSYSMAGSFTDGKNPVVSAMPLSEGAGKSVYLKIDGNIPRSSNYRTVGTVTVTLTDSE